MLAMMWHRGGKRPHTNRRTHRRAPLGRRVQFTQDGCVQSLPVEDISEGGLCIRGAHLPRGSRVKLFVPVPREGSDKDSLCVLWGVVVWTRDDRTGVRFIDPPLESLLQLRGYVQLAA